MDPYAQVPLRERNYDLVVFGATGFTGALISHHLCETVPKSLNWAIAGRSTEKLEKLQNVLNSIESYKKVPEVLDFATYSPVSIIRNTKVVLSAVGPSTYNAERFLRACVEEGTAWVDLTGEVPWIRKMIQRYGRRAEETGSIIIPSCGYDCIPSDIGLFLLAKQMGGNLTTVKAVFEDARHSPTASSGSIASILAYFGEFDYEEEIAGSEGFLENPYYLYPNPGKYHLPEQRTGSEVLQIPPNTFYFSDDHEPGISYNDAAGGTIATHGIVEATNRSVVCRTIGLIAENSGYNSYGDNIDYREYILIPPGPLSHFAAGKISHFLHSTLPWALSHTAVRTAAKLFVDWFLGPNGGPTEKQRLEGGFRMRVVGDREQDDARGYVEITGHGDPGYAWTTVTIAETALYLALRLRGDRIPLGGAPLPEYSEHTGDIIFHGEDVGKGGFWTPACLGMGLVRWLYKREVVELETGWQRNESRKDM